MLGVVQVRRLDASEWPRYREIRLAALRDSPDAFGSTWAAESRRPDEHWQQTALRRSGGDDEVVFVAADDADAWVGLVGAYRPGEMGADVDLVSMWVAPAARGAGVGHLLVRAVVEWAVCGGASTVGLWVTRGNQPATALYASEGFRPTGDVQPLPSNPGKDEMRMSRPLSARLA